MHHYICFSGKLKIQIRKGKIWKIFLVTGRKAKPVDFKQINARHPPVKLSFVQPSLLAPVATNLFAPPVANYQCSGLEDFNLLAVQINFKLSFITNRTQVGVIYFVL